MDMLRQEKREESAGEDMRRKDREIKDQEKMLAIMHDCDCCRIGLVDGKEAYIVPMNFGYEETKGNINLYFHCAKEGRKLDLLSGQEVVTFEMDAKHTLVEGKAGCDFSYLYQCIMGRGEMEIVEDEVQKRYGLWKILQHYSDAAKREFYPELLERVCVLKLSVTEWSCKEH